MLNFCSAFQSALFNLPASKSTSKLVHSKPCFCLEKKRLRDREAVYLARIEQERQRADDLLRVILPGEVADNWLEWRGDGGEGERNHQPQSVESVASAAEPPFPQK